MVPPSRHPARDRSITSTIFARCAALAALLNVAAGGAGAAEDKPSSAAERFDAPIERLALAHGVPESLIRRVIVRESRYAPHLVNRGHYGLMQIKLGTAKTMGYQGTAKGLLDGETNLTYAVPYLANAYLAADRNESRAVALYAGGYYYVAKRKRLLPELRTAKSEPLAVEPAIAYADQPPEPAPQPASPFAFLFGQTPAPQPSELQAQPSGLQAQASAEEQQVAEDVEAVAVVFENAPLPPRRPANL